MDNNKLQNLLDQKPYLQGPLDFVNQIIMISSKNKADDFSSLISDKGGNTQLIDPRLFQKQDLTNTVQLYLKLMYFVMEQNDILKQTYSTMYSQWKNDPKTLRAFLLELILGDPQNKCLARTEITVFLLKASLRPSFNALIEKSDISHDINNCPVCGFPPEMGVATSDKDSIKLVCSLCGNRWKFPDNMCPHCNTKEELTTTKTSDNTSITGCNSCKRYFRVITDITIATLDDRLLDIISDHANVFAEDQGFKPNSI